MLVPDHRRPPVSRPVPDRRGARRRWKVVAHAALLTTPLRGANAAPAVAPGEADPGSRDRPLCLYVSSYHRGYSWSDGVERGLREALGERCRVEQFDMDTKRQRTKEDMERAAARADALVERLAPDVVITSDDNAAKYFVVPYLKGGRVPVVFNGINWTVEEYGFPAANVTGIVEVAPIQPMIREGLALASGGTRAVYLGASTLTEQKNYERIAEVAGEFGVTLERLAVETLERWKEAFDEAQDYDFVIMGSYSGITRWDIDEASAHAVARTRRPSLTNHDWMMPVTAIGYTKLPEEHGERAGAMALAILDGTAVADIPLITNRKWDTWINPDIAGRMDAQLPERLQRRAKQADGRP